MSSTTQAGGNVTNATDDANATQATDASANATATSAGVADATNASANTTAASDAVADATNASANDTANASANASAASAAVAEATNASAAVVTVAAAVLNSSVETDMEISRLREDLGSMHDDLHKILYRIHNASEAATAIQGVPLTPTASPDGVQSPTTGAQSPASATSQTAEALTTTAGVPTANAGAQTTTTTTQTAVSQDFGNGTLPNFSLPADLTTGNITGNISSAVAAAEAAVDVVSNITSMSTEQAKEVDGLKREMTDMHNDVDHILRDLNDPAIARGVLPGAANGAPVPGSAVPGSVVPGSAVPGPAMPGPAMPGPVVPPTLAPLPPAPAQLPPAPNLQPLSNPVAAAPVQEGAWDTAHEALDHYHDGVASGMDIGASSGMSDAAASPAAATSDSAAANTQLFACADCTKHGFGPDSCGCGVCGSFGQCTFSCENTHDPKDPGAHLWPCLKAGVPDDASVVGATTDIASIEADVVNLGTKMAAEMSHMHSDVHHILSRLEEDQAPAAGSVDATESRMETPSAEGYLPADHLANAPPPPVGGAGASGQLSGADASGQLSEADGAAVSPMGAVTTASTGLPLVDTVIGCCFSMETDWDQVPCCLRKWRSVRESCSWEYLPTEAQAATLLGWKQDGCPSSVDEAKMSIEHQKLEAEWQAEELAKQGRSTTWWPGQGPPEGAA